jgi:hypothetical protein
MSPYRNKVQPGMREPPDVEQGLKHVDPPISRLARIKDRIRPRFQPYDPESEPYTNSFTVVKRCVCAFVFLHVLVVISFLAIVIVGLDGVAYRLFF